MPSRVYVCIFMFNSYAIQAGYSLIHKYDACIMYMCVLRRHVMSTIYIYVPTCVLDTHALFRAQFKPFISKIASVMRDYV
jgi:hypothetical protein